MSAKDYAITFRLALAKAKITKPVRPFHDGRHGHLTNAAAAGVSPAALQARAGHADMLTTQLYSCISTWPAFASARRPSWPRPACSAAHPHPP